MNRLRILAGFEKARHRYEEAVDLMKVHLRYLIRERGLMHASEAEQRVTGRVKSAESVLRKLRRIERRQRIRVTTWADAERVLNDIAGIRVVCNYLDELLLVYGYLRKQPAFRELQARFEDYVRHPKVGYRGLHSVFRIRTTFGEARCEVQIRTALQDAWAVKSHALVYKLKKTELQQLPAQVKNLLINQSDQLYTIDRAFKEIASLIARYLRGSTR